MEQEITDDIKKIKKHDWQQARDLTALSIQEGVLAYEWCSRQLLLVIFREKLEQDKRGHSEVITDEEVKMLSRGLLQSQKLFWEAWEKFCKER